MEFVEFSSNLDENLLASKNIVIKNSFVADGVKIGTDVCIFNSKVESGCIIGQNCCIKNATIGKNVVITSSLVLNSSVADNLNVGPFAIIRNGNAVGEMVV